MIKNKMFLAISSACFLYANNIANAADLNDDLVIVESPTQYYIATRLGVAFTDDTSFDLNSAAAVPTGIDNTYEDSNVIGSFAAGKEFGNGFRGEIEVSYGKSDIETHTIVALPATFSGSDAFGETTVLTGLVNGYYDFDFGGFTPYVSAGVGIGRIDFENHGVVIPAGGAAGLPAGPITAMNDGGNGLAWQIGAGVGFDVTSSTVLELGYRYQSIENVNLTAVDSTQTDVDFSTHNVTAGLRFKF